MLYCMAFKLKLMLQTLDSPLFMKKMVLKVYKYVFAEKYCQVCYTHCDHAILFPGASQEQTFLGSIYKYDLQLLQGWEEITPRGGLEREVRLRDHTSVYHYDTKSILVFGGLKSPQT